MKTMNVDSFVNYNDHNISRVIKLTHPAQEPVTRISDSESVFSFKDVNVFRTMNEIAKLISKPQE